MGLTGALWLASLLFHITYFGTDVAWTLQGGFIGIYWGDRGGPDVRNSWVYNGFVAPWNASGAGAGWDGEPTWQIETPSEVWNPISIEALVAEGCSLLKLRCGVLWPQIILNSTRHAVEPPTVILPLWLPFGAVLLATQWSWVRNRRRPPPGHCLACGYNLSGLTSGRCPECGTPAPKLAPV